MATYKSNPRKVQRSAEDLFDTFSDFTNLQNSLDNLTEEQRSQIGNVQFTSDSIKIVTPQVGEIEFHVTERQRPGKLVFGTKSSPVPMKMKLLITPLGADFAEVTSQIDVEIPAMLRPLVGPQLQKAADKFGELIAGLSRR
ncbi:MAG: hypothetical protein K2H14_07120 [Muribaculaceae bacterium]|nr:hypothetical protein [Muribaculaceae bacterium]